MSFRQIARAQTFLRVAAGQELTKEALVAGLIGKAALGVGKSIAGSAVKNPMGFVGKAMTAAGVASEAGGAVQKAKAYNVGFKPAVQQYMSTPLGG